MAQIVKVLLYSMLFLLVYGQKPAPRPIQPLPEGRILDLVSLSKLLQTAARLAYPITDRLNYVVGNLRDMENYPFISSHPPNTGYASSRRPNINKNLGRNRHRSDFHDLRRVHQDTRRRQPHKPIYDYDYEYDYDSEYSDYMEPLDSLEVEDDLGVLLDLEPKAPNTHGVLLPDGHNKVPKHKLVPASKKPGKRPNHLLNDGGSKQLKYPPGNSAPIINSVKAPGNVLPVQNEPQPKIIYVVVSPGDINPGMNKENTINLVNNQGLNEDGISNAENGFIVVPDAGSGAPNVNIVKQ